MKNIVFILILLVSFSCKKEAKKENLADNDSKIEQIVIDSSTKVANEKPIGSVIEKSAQIGSTSYKPIEKITISDFSNKLGYYVGDFVMVSDEYKENASYTNLINISVDAITNDSIYGHSVVAGNIRPFRGEFDVENLHAIVNEPGDDIYDGKFEFKFNENKIIGKWLANDKSITVNSRKYTLQKTEFKYNPSFNIEFVDGYNDFILSEKHEYNYESGDYEKIDGNNLAEINASNKKLTNKEIENLNKGELEVLRNLVYARHGYSFKNRKMRYFFDSNIDWYIPTSTDVRNKLTDIEKQNIDLIKRYEQHAERYYDYFGR